MTIDAAVEQARQERLREGLKNLAAWCEKRVEGNHDSDTTLTMLERKANGLRQSILKAGWKAANDYQHQ